MTLASVVIQDLTFTETQLGSGVTFIYTNTGTAGAEVVTVEPFTHVISIAIQSGISTATQIKAAFDAKPTAVALATCAISGTGSNAQKSCVSAPLAGGTALAVATITVESTLLLTAVTAGTGGNSIRFKFTSGATAGSEAVTVSTNDISVQIAEGVSTYAQVVAALAGSGAAAALVTASLLLAGSRPAHVGAMSAFTALSGGTAATAASKVVQDLTFSRNVTGTGANGSTVSYTTGATAGSEVVSGTSSAASVQIENGVSTATQIKTALDAVSTVSATVATCSGTITFGSPSNGDTVIITGLPTDGTKTFTKAASASGNNFTVIADLTSLINALTDLNATDNGTVVTVTVATKGTAMNSVTITGTGAYVALSRTFIGGTNGLTTTVSGTGSTAQKTVNAAPMTGAVGAGPDVYYKSNSITALTASFVLQAITFPVKLLVMHNDETSGEKTIIGSFDGTNTAFTIAATESLELREFGLQKLWLKYGSAAPAYRLSAL